jgi:hypothetical protein
MTTKPETTSSANGAKLVNLKLNDLDTIIYRTFDKKWFERLLVASTNGLVRPSKWDDPFENFLLARSVVTTNTGTIGSLDSLARDWYGQCWTVTEESDAIWRIYSPRKNGIRVAVRLGDLLDQLVSVATHPSLQAFAGRVLYWTETEIKTYVQNLTFTDLALGGTNDRFAELLCIKREAFEHENEVRILFNDLTPPVASNEVLSHPFCCKTLLRGVVLDPRLSDLSVKRRSNQLKKLGLALAPAASSLYRVPNFTIPLE